MKGAREEAERAYQERSAYLWDAYRVMPSGTGGAAKTTAPPADKPDDDEALSPRDQYIARISNMWRTPVGQCGRDDYYDPNTVEAQRRRWLSPGARPGTGYGDARPTRTVTKDAVADRDAAYAEYIARLQGGCRR